MAFHGVSSQTQIYHQSAVKTFIKCIFLSGYLMTFLVRLNHRGHQAHPSVLETGKLRLTEGRGQAQEPWEQEWNACSQAASPSGPAGGGFLP